MFAVSIDCTYQAISISVLSGSLHEEKREPMCFSRGFVHFHSRVCPAHIATRHGAIFRKIQNPKSKIQNRVTRSLKIRTDWLEKVKLSLRRNGIPNQKSLAAEVGLAVSTVSNFLTGKPVDHASFTALCDSLNLDWQTIADWGELAAIPNTSIAPIYIERPPIEDRCMAALSQPHSLIRIKSPQQMGKTALMDVLLDRANSQGYRTVKLSFHSADRAVFDDLDTLLRWVCNKIGRKLQLDRWANDCWSDIFGSKDNCTAYFEESILPASTAPLVLGWDDVDRLFAYPHLAADFFGLLRSWYEESGRGEWSKLRPIVAHATEVYVPLRSDESPFNVGVPIELPEFTPAQVAALVERYGETWTSDRVAELMASVGGHPYLLRLALEHLQQYPTDLTEFLALAATESSPFGSHLRSLRNLIKRQPNLRAALATLMQGDPAISIDPDAAFQLCSMGVAVRQVNEIVPRCQLYRSYFTSQT